jgi:hypothetical protein
MTAIADLQRSKEKGFGKLPQSSFPVEEEERFLGDLIV